MKEKENLRDPYISLFEMSKVRRFDNKWFYTRSSSETPVPGSRQEHLPPHVELVQNNQPILKLVIPPNTPSTINDIITEPEISNKIKRNLLKWFNEEEFDKTFNKKISAYEVAILFWNRDNDQYEIKYQVDRNGKIEITHYPTKRK